MNNVICLKHGDKYDHQYVNKLYNMVGRHLTIPYNFICFTENPLNLNQNIIIKPLPDYPLSGWWWKPYVFNDEHFETGDINLFIDLDMVIVDNIDKLFDHEPNDFVVLRDVGRIFNPAMVKMGSAVMKWPAKEYSDIWTKLINNISVINHFRGDQDWIWHLYSSQVKFFPDQWIQSYKWEIRSRTELTDFGPNSTFKTIKNPEIPDDTSILAFHGYPTISNVADPIIVDNWA